MVVLDESAGDEKLVVLDEERAGDELEEEEERVASERAGTEI